jgi:hypothetical protein
MLVTENDYTEEYEYNEGKFSTIYNEHVWMDNMKRSSFLCTLDRLMEMRGFQVIRPEITTAIRALKDYDSAPIEDQDKTEEEKRNQSKKEKEKKNQGKNEKEKKNEEIFEMYLNNSLTDTNRKEEECLDRRREALHRSKDELRKLIDSNPDHKKSYIEIRTLPRIYVTACVFRDQRGNMPAWPRCAVSGDLV